MVTGFPWPQVLVGCQSRITARADRAVAIPHVKALRIAMLNSVCLLRDAAHLLTRFKYSHSSGRFFVVRFRRDASDGGHHSYQADFGKEVARLSGEEREQLVSLIRKGNSAALGRLRPPGDGRPKILAKLDPDGCLARSVAATREETGAILKPVAVQTKTSRLAAHAKNRYMRYDYAPLMGANEIGHRN